MLKHVFAAFDPTEYNFKGWHTAAMAKKAAEDALKGGESDSDDSSYDDSDEDDESDAIPEEDNEQAEEEEENLDVGTPGMQITEHSEKSTELLSE